MPWWLRSRSARSGSTSMETRPSTPLVAAKVAAMMSQALRTSSVVSTLMASWSSGVARRELLDLLVVHVTLGKRRGEDRRVGRDSGDRVVRHEVGQVARGDALARQVVQPDGDAGVCEGLEPFVHDQFSWMSGGGVSWAQLIVTPGWASTSAGPLGPLAAGCVGAVVPVAASRLSCAAATTVSGVKPNSLNNRLPAALAP